MALSTASDPPHSLQNRAPAPFIVPHEEHVWESEAPQPLQNFAPSGFSVPQLEQRIARERTSWELLTLGG